MSQNEASSCCIGQILFYRNIINQYDGIYFSFWRCQVKLLLLRVLNRSL